MRSALVVLALALAPRGAPAQAARIMPPDARALVVKLISTSDSEATPEPGAGVIVGLTDDSVYIVTARHMVATLRRVFLEVRVSFAWDTTSVAAATRHHGGAELDLAVITVPRAAVPRLSGAAPGYDRLGSVSRLRFGAPVRAVGCPQGECWSPPPDPDKVVGLDRQGIIVETRSVQPGSSGGALFDEWWEVVGIVVDKASPRANAIPMDRVVSQLEHWGVPLTLHRPAIPRGGYPMTMGAGFFASNQFSFDRLPSGRGTFERRLSSRLIWRFGGLRLAPENVAAWAVTAGFGIELHPVLSRLTIQPFAELGYASVEGRHDTGGYYVTSASGAVYVPVWQRVTATGLGSGAGVAIMFVVEPKIIAELTVGHWRFPAPAPLRPVSRTELSIGARHAIY